MKMSDKQEKITRDVAITDQTIKVRAKRYKVSWFKLITWPLWPYWLFEYLHYRLIVNDDLAWQGWTEIKKYGIIWSVVAMVFWTLMLGRINYWLIIGGVAYIAFLWLHEIVLAGDRIWTRILFSVCLMAMGLACIYFMPLAIIGFGFVHVSVTLILNFQFVWPKNRFATPDYTTYEKSDKPIDYRFFPYPTRDRFALGVSGKEYFYYSFGKTPFKSNLVVIGEDVWDRGGIVKVLSWGAMGDPDTILCFADAKGGQNLANLLYDPDGLENLNGEQDLAKVSQLESLPNVFVAQAIEISPDKGISWTEAKIKDMLDWLHKELQRRLVYKTRVPNIRPWPRIVVFLDEAVSEFAFTGRDGEDNRTGFTGQNQALDDLYTLGGEAKINLVLLAPSHQEFSKLKLKYQPLADPLEFHHRSFIKQRDGEESGGKGMPFNVVSAYANNIRFMFRGQWEKMVVPSISGADLAQWIKERSEMSGFETEETYNAIREMWPYEPKITPMAKNSRERVIKISDRLIEINADRKTWKEKKTI